MYQYRKLNSVQQDALVQERLARGFPAHSPPHQVRDGTQYLLTAACYEHAPHMASAQRRREVLHLLQGETAIGVAAWVVLPNHYHLLASVPDLAAAGRAMGRIHGTLSRKWNLEDATRGRSVWYRFADRAIRSERHWYTALNYLHHNPVKHGWAAAPGQWAESSFGRYLSALGPEGMDDLWAQYPVREFGRGWDDLPTSAPAG